MSTDTDNAEPMVARVNRLDLLERVADDLAHEIKNPLHSMVINLEVLKRRAARCSPDEAEQLLRYADVIGSELERLSRRVDLLLRFTRPARRAEDATPAELLDELLELLRVQAARRDVQLRYEPNGTTAPATRIARDPFQQIVLNVAHEVLGLLGRGDVLELRLGDDGEHGRVVVSGRSAHTGAGEMEARLVADGDSAEHGDRPLVMAHALAEPLGVRIELAPRAGTDALDVVLHLPAAPR